MCKSIRISAGLVVLLALLLVATILPAAAQGPTGTACTDVATFVRDVTVPDGSTIAPGATFTKTWQMRNRGTCTWETGYTLNFISGQALTSTTSIPVPTTAPVATADLYVLMTAPATAETVQGFWQLRNPSGRAFGPRVWVLVRVASGPAAAPPLQGGVTPSPVPAQAPPLSATGTNLDDPALAANFGNAIPSLPSGGAEWLQFAYDNGGNALPRPSVTIRLVNGFANGLTFDVYSPESMVGGWTNNKPIGRGTPETVVNCNQGGVNVGRCQTNDLVWTGGFGLNGTYFVRVNNATGSIVAPELIISGPGLAQCLGAQSNSTAIIGPTNTQGSFSQVQCSNTITGAISP